MPFIINGQKVNKPIYNGVILNAMHVWLQNHWTGTANASTSTLSQDGQVVATNLFPYPKPTSLVSFAEILRASTSFPSSGGMLVQQTSGVNKGAGAFVKIRLPSLSAGTYHVLATMSPSASVKPPAPTYMGRKMICIVTDTTLGLAGDNTVSQGVRSFTFTADGSTSYYLALFAGDGSGDTSMSVLWQNIILLSDADWSAMQARGVTWFDGDSYVRGGV